MATITTTPGYTFTSSETVEANDLNLLGSPTVAISNIVNADIGSGAAIEASKLAATLDLSSKTVTLPATSVGATALASNAVTTAKINNAAVTAAKLDGAQTGSAPIYGCRAWVNFDGTRNAADTGASTNGANVKIRASGNVASVLKNSAGDYTITFTTAMPDASYCVSGVATSNVGTEPNCVMVALASSSSYLSKTTSSVRIYMSDTNALGSQDTFDSNVLIFR